LWRWKGEGNIKGEEMKKIIIFLIAILGFFQIIEAKWSRNYKNEIKHKDVIVKQDEELKETVITDKSITIDGKLEGDCISFGGDIVIRGRVYGNTVSFGGKIFNSGKVDGDMVSLGSNIENSGDVDGNIVSVGGDIILKSGSKIAGDITSTGGMVEKDDDVIIQGKTTSLNIKSAKKLSSSIIKFVNYFIKENREDEGFFSIFKILSFGFIFLFSIIFSILIILIIPLIFFSKNVENIARNIAENLYLSFGIGILISISIFPALLIVIISIIGIPLVPFIILLIFISLIFGFSGFSLVLANKFFEGIKKEGPKSIMWRGFIGYLIIISLIIFGIIPFIGWIFYFIALIIILFGLVIGLGSVWKTRFGTR